MDLIATLLQDLDIDTFLILLGTATMVALIMEATPKDMPDVMKLIMGFFLAFALTLVFKWYVGGPIANVDALVFTIAAWFMAMVLPRATQLIRRVRMNGTYRE